MSAIESFQTSPLQRVIPSYLYQEYADDDDLQAFVDSYNALAQGYHNWFLFTPLGLYTAPGISGALLDWIGQGIYGISRPTLASQTSSITAGYNSVTYNTIPYNGLVFSENGSSSIATDDIYKRVMTWNLYRGDGQVFTIGWLKNRINRFLNGVNGSDYAVLEEPPSITVSGNVFTVTAFGNSSFNALQQCYESGALSFPFQYTLAFNSFFFVNDGGVMTMTSRLYFPGSPTGLPDGAVWYNGGVLSVIPGITPDPTAPPLYFATVIPLELLLLGGGNLPLTNPGAGTGQLWNNGGLICIA
jgi:hypothetical protein